MAAHFRICRSTASRSRYCNDLVHPIVVWVVTIWSKVNTTAAGALMRDATKCRLYTGSPVYTVFAYTVPHPTAWSMFYAATHPYLAYKSHLIGLYGPITIAIRARFSYNTLQHATRFFVRSHTRSYTRISGRRVLHVD